MNVLPPAVSVGADRRLGPLDVDLLHEAAGVAERLEAPLLHLRAEVVGGNPLVARAARAPVERVAGEERHVRADVASVIGDGVESAAAALAMAALTVSRIAEAIRRAAGHHAVTHDDGKDLSIHGQILPGCGRGRSTSCRPWHMIGGRP